MAWYVLCTKPRNEKKLAGLLGREGVKVYCPLNEEIRQWSDRRKKIMSPIFKGYLFVWLENYKDEATFVLNMPGAVRFLWWAGNPGVVRQDEVEAIQHFITLYRYAAIDTEIKQGQSVTIKEGPLKENEGTVIKVKGDRAYLHLRSLGVNLIAKVQVQVLKINDPGV